MATPMGMQSSDPLVRSSSTIALLQERFRQVQRSKEMREERELFRPLSDTTYYHYEPFLILAESYQQPPPQSDLKLLQLCPQLMQHKDVAENKEMKPVSLSNVGTVVHCETAVSDDECSDVDTSLHL